MTTHVETACAFCLVCGHVVAEGENSDAENVLVSVLQGDDPVFDCTLVMHTECASESGLDLLRVRALGRALVRAAEYKASKPESQSRARAARR